MASSKFYIGTDACDNSSKALGSGTGSTNDGPRCLSKSTFYINLDEYCPYTKTTEVSAHHQLALRSNVATIQSISHGNKTFVTYSNEMSSSNQFDDVAITWVQKCTVYEKRLPSSGAIVTVQCGRLNHVYDCDVLLLPNDGDLNMNTEPVKYMKCHGGRGIKADYNERGRALPGRAMATSAGNLPFYSIIHAVISNSTSPDASNLQRALRDSFTQVLPTDLSILIPMNGFGECKFSIVVESLIGCLKVIKLVDRVLPLRITLLNGDSQQCEQLASHLEAEFGADEQVEGSQASLTKPVIAIPHRTEEFSAATTFANKDRGMVFTQSSAVSTISLPDLIEREQSLKPQKITNNNCTFPSSLRSASGSALSPVSEYRKPVSKEGAGDGELIIHGRVIFKIKKGSSENCQQQALVHSTGKSLELNEKLVSKAGHVLKAACQKLAPLLEGEVKETLGFDLKCKRILHCHVAGVYQGNQSNLKLKKLMMKCLDMADKRFSLSSVAFPALGTDADLKYPAETVCRLVIEAVTEYVAKNSPTNLREVVLLADSSLMQCFSKVLNTAEHEPSLFKTMPRSQQFGGSDINLDCSCHQAESPSPTSFPDYQMSAPIAINPPISYELKNTKLKLVYRNIFGVSADALICTTNWNFSGGNEPEKEPCYQIPHPLSAFENSVPAIKLTFSNLLAKPRKIRGFRTSGMPSYGVCVLPGGSLRAKHILLLNSYLPWTKLIINCLRICDSKGWSSMAFPAIGTGVAGKSSSEMAKLMVSSILSYLRSHEETSLKLIRIAIYQEKIYEDFMTALKHAGEEKISRNMAIRETLTGIFRNADWNPKSDHIDDPVGPQAGGIYISVSGNSQTSVDVAMSAINSRLNKDLYKLEMPECLHQALSIPELNSQEVDYLMEIADIMLVEMNIVLDSNSPQIELVGSKAAVYLVRQKVIEILLAIGQWKTQQVEMEKLGTAHWRDHEWPEHWDHAYSGYCTVPLHQRSEEYQKVKQNFRQTLGNASNLQILEIRRVQQLKLYKNYLVHRRFTAQKLNLKEEEVERTLWHGSAQTSIEAIARSFFNRSYAGDANARRYGRGSYFAVNAEYSANHKYARKNSSGEQFVFQVRVVVGEFTNGNSEMKVAPEKQGSHVQYDSVVDDVNNPNVFVVFTDVAAYPEYIVKFKK